MVPARPLKSLGQREPATGDARAPSGGRRGDCGHRGCRSADSRSPGTRPAPGSHRAQPFILRAARMPRWQCGEHLPRSYHQSAAAPLRDSDNDNTMMVTTAISRGCACAAPGTGGHALRALRVLILVGTPCPASSVPSVAWIRKVGGPRVVLVSPKARLLGGGP